jgi:hypothetical protein
MPKQVRIDALGTYRISMDYESALQLSGESSERFSTRDTRLLLPQHGDATNAIILTRSGTATSSRKSPLLTKIELLINSYQLTLMDDYSRLLEIRLIHSSVRHPQTNGKSEPGALCGRCSYGVAPVLFVIRCSLNV